jgi:flagellar basal-body rod protein FlgF
MDNAAYVTLTRMSGLKREMQVIAHNIANASTTGFRREAMVFSEFVARAGGQEASISMGLGQYAPDLSAAGRADADGRQFRSGHRRGRVLPVGNPLMVPA